MQLFVATPAFCLQTLQGKIVKVSDGDTVKLLTADQEQIKIRLLGIDAPEKRQPFGEASRKSLSEMIAGKTVEVQVLKKDRYGRSLGKVFLLEKEFKTDVGLKQIEHGMAWHYTYFQKDQPLADRKLYETSEKAARDGKKGLWIQPKESLVAPWDWRKQTKKSKLKNHSLSKQKKLQDLFSRNFRFLLLEFQKV